MERSYEEVSGISRSAVAQVSINEYQANSNDEDIVNMLIKLNSDLDGKTKH